jgi:hypothetical protein
MKKKSKQKNITSVPFIQMFTVKKFPGIVASLLQPLDNLPELPEC